MRESRRFVLAGLVAAPALHAAGRARAADLDVAIVGAGAAGLVAAHRARERKLSARIFEARNRVGGRVHTDRSLGPAFDAGAFYIHFSERNPWKPIAESLKVPLVDDSGLWGGFDVFRDGKPLPVEERARRRGVFGRLSDVMEGREATFDLSFAEAARQRVPDYPEAANGLTLLSLGEEPDRVSVRDYQQLDSGEDHVVPSGYGTLLERYAEGLDIRLATPVTAIDYSRPLARLETPAGVVTARHVVITVPVNVLKAGAIRFTPALPARTRAALDGLGMGALTKVALHYEGTRFDQAPWTQFFDQGRAGDLINFEFWPFGQNLVVAFFGGDFARGLAAAGEAEAVSVIRGRFEAIVGSQAAKAFRGGRLAGWSADPLSLGCYSIARPGHANARATLAEPVANRLFFAGEASAGRASMTAGGAAISARRAVDQIALPG